MLYTENTYFAPNITFMCKNVIKLLTLKLIININKYNKTKRYRSIYAILHTKILQYNLLILEARQIKFLNNFSRIISHEYFG